MTAPADVRRGRAWGLHRRAFALAWEVGPGRIVLRAVLAVAGGLVPVGVAWLTKLVLDRIAAGSPTLLVALALAALGVGAVVLPELTRYVEREMTRQVGLRARVRLAEAVGRMHGLEAFEDPVFHDRLQVATDAGPSGPPQILSAGFGLAQGAMLLAGFTVTLLAINPWMALVVLLAALPTLRAEMLLASARAGMQRDLGRAARREFFYSHLISGVTAAKEVRLYDLNALFGARMVTELRGINERHRELDRRELALQGLLGVVGALVAGGGLVWAAGAAGRGELTVGDVAVFAAAVAGVQSGLSLMISMLADGHEAALLFECYDEIVSEHAEEPPDDPPTHATAGGSSGLVAARTVELPSLHSTLELRDVWFRYADDLPWVLQGVDLVLPAGSSLALVGRNGAGKSTLVKLLCRFYDPTRGQVLWDGVDLRDVHPRELRRRLGVVFQDHVQYELTAAENIGLGDVARLEDRAAIEEAARRAEVAADVEALPAAYDTMLSRVYMDPTDREEQSTGVVLSGGQWQRLALARALFRQDSELLILDEPSAGLDPEAEHLLRLRLQEHRAGRTSLLISHRLASVRDADLVAVLDDGRVVETGTHEQLLQSGSLYATLFDFQADGYR